MEIEIKTNKTVGEIKCGDKNIDIQVILIKLLDSHKIKNGSSITTFLVGDETGSIQCTFFDNVSQFIKEGDVLYITGAYSTLYNKHIVLYQPKIGYGFVTKVDEFFFPFSLKPNISEKEFDPQNNNLK